MSPRTRASLALSVLLTGSLLLAACSSSTTSTKSSSSATPTSAAPATGGTLTYAEQPASTPDYIFPFDGAADYSTANIPEFQGLMWSPLFDFGSGTSAGLDEATSVAEPPVYSHNDQQITVTLKPWKFSDGESVSASDVMFWMNMLRAEKTNWAVYTPGAFPDNVTDVVVDSPTSLTFTLAKSYNPTWFTDNELRQVLPMPAAWDITSAGAAPGSGGCASVAYTSITVNAKGAPASPSALTCAKVYDFLSTQSGYDPTNPNSTSVEGITTFASNPIWQVVDGPWHLVSLSATGEAVFAPNPDYSGTEKPHVAKFVEVPFTSSTAEINALDAHQVDIGYLPLDDITTDAPSLTTPGPNPTQLNGNYRLETVARWMIDYMPLNFNSTGDGGLAGKIFDQLYVRQALQMLIDQPLFDAKVYKGYGYPTTGPVPTIPDTYESSVERADPYAYDPQKAVALLREHGWKVVPGGTSTCTDATKCGSGIPDGARLSFTLLYRSGVPSLQQIMSDEAAAWAQAGIHVSLSQATFDTVISVANPCPSGCAWEMADWGGGWSGFGALPTGEQVFGPSSPSNSGNYESPTNAANIAAVETSSASDIFDTYENYLADQLPGLWEPNQLDLVEVARNVDTGVLNAINPVDPQNWYFTKS